MIIPMNRFVRSFPLHVLLFAILLMPLGNGIYAADLHAVYVLAEKSDPEYKQVVATNQATLQQRPLAMSQLLPTLSLSAATSRNEQDISSTFTAPGVPNPVVFNSHNYSLSLSQPLFRWDLFLGFKQTDSIIAQSNAELLAARQDLIVRVAEAYFNVLGAGDDLEFARSDKISLSRQLEQANQRFEVGLTAITDVQEAQAGYDRAVAAEIEALNNVDNTREVLREITGEYMMDFAVLGATLPLVSPEPESIQAWTETALEQSLEVVAAIYAVDTAREQVKIVNAGHLPTLDLNGSKAYIKSGGRFGSNKIHSTNIGLLLNVPIYQGGFVNASMRAAVARLDEQLQRLERARRLAQSSTRQSYLGVISGISQVKAFKQALVSTETALQATEAGFEVGTRTAVDVVTSQRATFEARRNYARSRYDYLLDTLRLKRAAGILSTDDLITINQWLN